jgi:hypothetical protein
MRPDGAAGIPARLHTEAANSAGAPGRRPVRPHTARRMGPWAHRSLTLSFGAHRGLLFSPAPTPRPRAARGGGLRGMAWHEVVRIRRGPRVHAWRDFEHVRRGPRVHARGERSDARYPASHPACATSHPACATSHPACATSHPACATSEARVRPQRSRVRPQRSRVRRQRSRRAKARPAEEWDPTGFAGWARRSRDLLVRRLRCRD